MARKTKAPNVTTDERMAEIIEAYKAKHGRPPSFTGGDATSWFGFPTTWAKEGKKLDRRGLSLAILGAESARILRGPALTPDSIREAGRRQKNPTVPTTFLLPTVGTSRYLLLKATRGANASLAFGHPECWVSVGLAATHGWRGLDGTQCLGEILRPGHYQRVDWAR